MEVRPGYKMTEVGVIPEDWSVISVGALASFTSGTGINVGSLAGKSSETPVPVFGGNGVAGYTSRPLVREPTVVVGRVGQKCGEVCFSSGPAWITDNALFPRTRHREFDVRFLVFALAGAGLNDVKNRNDLPLVTQAILHSVRIAWPPDVEEQRAIATTLSDVDALLGGLERLIAKKRDLKQAAMQQLLTGQTRLPGFSGEWEVKRLGEIAHIKTGSRNNEDKIDGGEYPFFVRSENVERIDSYSHDCEAILVPGEGRIGDIFHYINGRFDVHQRVYAITRFGPGMFAKFVHLYMAMNFGAWAIQNTVKATVDSLRLPTFQTFKMKVPPTKEEQTAIATVLSDMDAEIAALEARRDKTRALKQGMMQELLTGRIRLS